MSRDCKCDWCVNNPVLPIEADNDKFEQMADLLTRAVFIQQQVNRGV